MTPDNLSFFHRFAVTQHSQLVDNSLDSNDLTSTVNAITMTAGTTNLEIVSFDRGYGNVSHRFCLSTIWQVTDGGEKYKQVCFTLSAHELDTLSDSGASDGVFSWIELRSNLLHRESDRAYLYVKHWLMASNVASACAKRPHMPINGTPRLPQTLASLGRSVSDARSRMAAGFRGAFAVSSMRSR